MNMNDAFLGSLIFNKNSGGGGEFSITLTKEDDIYSIDKTSEEILAAYNEGKTIVLCPDFHNFYGKIICNSITINESTGNAMGFGFVGAMWGGSDDFYQLCCYLEPKCDIIEVGYSTIYSLYT